MTSSSQIRSTARQIYHLTQDVKREIHSVNREVNSSANYWSGTAASSFITEQSAAVKRLDRLVRSLESIESGLNRLAHEVQRAEQEREAKRRLEEQMRLAKQKK